MANELEISKRSVLLHKIPHVLLTEQGLFIELRNALKKGRTPSPNQKKFMADLTSVEHEKVGLTLRHRPQRGVIKDWMKRSNPG